MKRISIEVSLVITLISLTYLGLITYAEQRLFRFDSYTAMSVAKEQRLKKLKGPKLILVGGSNLLFGFDSNLLQKDRQKKVVNMGVNAGFGLPFILNEAIEQVKRKDTIILCPEYYVENGTLTVQVELNAANPAARPRFNYNLFEKIRFHTTRFQKNVFVAFAYIGKKPHTPRTYQLNNINEFGDIKQMYPEDKKPIIPEEIIVQSTYDSGIAQLNAFINESEKRGAVVYFTFPPLCVSEFNLNKASLTALETIIRKRLRCKLLGTVKSFSYPDTFFFDTIYHLNVQGRSVRTKQLIQLLDEQRG